MEGQQANTSIEQDSVVKRESLSSCGAGSKADASGVKAENACTTFHCEAMDTNNNNNLEATETHLRANPEARDPSFPSKIRTSEGVGEPQVSETRAIPPRNARSAIVCKTTDPLLSHSAVRPGDAGGPRSSSGRVRSFGPSPQGFGLISPDFPGTPNSVSQLFNLPSSAFSLDGIDFPSGLGSGQFSPLTSARLGRKRNLSISPLSSSSLDLNNLIRTSPTSLVNYITNSRGSSAGSMGHLSPSLLANHALFQPPYNRPLLSLRNAAHPQPNTTALNGRKSESVPNEAEAVHIKKEATEEEVMQNGADCCRAQLTALVKQEHAHLYETGTSTENSKGLHVGILETVQEEGGISDDEGMQTDPTDYSSAITENESELDSKQREKPKRIYYSYPSSEEPHNNRCRWLDCNRQCETLEDLVRHVNSDHIYRDSRKEFVCCWSGCVRERRPFKAQYMLLVHMRRHTGEKPHKCSFEGCNKAYSRLENLKTHLRSHTGERPYICKVEGCGKAFSNASDCAKHVNRTHSDDKPYACPNPGCTKRYTDPSSRRKHMKNCQVNKKARTDDRDAMSGADEESSAETNSTKASSSTKKPNKPRKSERRKQPQSFKNAPFGTVVHPGSAVDHGYVSSHTGYYSSGYETEYPSLQGEEEFTRILRQQSVGGQPEISPVGYTVANGQYPHPPLSSSSLMMDSTPPNVKASRQKGGGLAMPAGQNVPNPVPHPVHHAYPPFSQPSLQTQFLPSFQCCPSSQSGLSSFPQQEIQYPHCTMQQQHVLPMNNENSPPINAHSGTISDYSGKFLVPSHPKVSGYAGTSFRSISPPKAGTTSRKSPSDDGSVISSFRSSLHTNSYSTFSSNSSRVSSPCSNSGRSDTLRAHPPRSPQHNHMKTSSCNRGDPNFPLKHSVRMYYMTKQDVGRRHSDEFSDSVSTRTWLHSSHSSRYSHTSSELSDDFLDSLPTDFSRRDSFSKMQPLPLPESMQQQFSALSVRVEFTQENGNMGMELGPPNGTMDTTYNHPINDIHDTTPGTFPLHHFDTNTSAALSYPNHQLSPDGGFFSQGLSDEGFDTLGSAFYNGAPVSTPNMAVGNMSSFASTLAEETQYLENLLNSQVR